MPLKGLVAEPEPRRYVLEKVIKIDTGLKKDAVSKEINVSGRQPPAVFFEEIAGSPDKIAERDVCSEPDGGQRVLFWPRGIKAITKDEEIVPIRLRASLDVGTKKEQRLPIETEFMYEILLMKTEGNAQIDGRAKVILEILQGKDGQELQVVIVMFG